MISRALNVVIKLLSKFWNTLEMGKTSDFTTKLKRLNKINSWRSLLSKGNVTFIEFDIKEQYTNLNRSDVMKALGFALSTISQRTKKPASSFAIHRNKTFKSQDAIGRKPPKHFRNITFQNIFDYANFELETSQFLVGSSLVHNKKAYLWVP